MKRLLFFCSCLLTAFSLEAQTAGSLAENFQHPPADARPWVYWFWNNANVTSNGITADLEAMQRNGIGGVLIMDVFERFAPPRGTAEFMNPEWRNLFEFSVQEAARLGLEINMANGPGWCGSSGPWITPELSMQMLVSTNIPVVGLTNFSGVMPKPNTGAGKQRRDGLDSSVKYNDYYRDIAVLAFPKTANGIVPRNAVVDLTAKLDADGKLNWDVPAGEWLIARIGHTSTGSSTRPPVAGGNGLECDKLSAAAMDVHFANMMGRLITNAGPLAGKSLVATHIDSWEVGSQNWTPKLREKFQKRRGYDPVSFLPDILDSVREKVNEKIVTRYPHQVGGAEAAARFRWDFAQTISELLAENYSGRLAELAHEHGLRYSLEGYTLPFGDQFPYTARADEPMTEFWTGYKFNADYLDTRAAQAASVAHVYGRPVVGAEAFTSGDKEMWKATPADIKALGDFEFCAGVNRFVVHRYAHQPYLDRAPGATMGPWGLHYERTQTWWEMSGAWHEYVARCQYLLRQGKFVADLLYLRPERPNQQQFNPQPAPPKGYRHDEISAEALLQRVSVREGKLVLPDGMNYRVLVLPAEKIMTPALAEKIRQLVSDGATVLATAAAPQTSPSLNNFPECDRAVAKITGEVWGDCDGQTKTVHQYGKGKLVFGQTLQKIFTDLQTPPDFTGAALNWVHRSTSDAEIYFVANPTKKVFSGDCTFRVHGLAPEIWNPETGETTATAMFTQNADGISVPLFLRSSDSTFVIFRQPAVNLDSVVSLTRNGKTVLSEPTPQKIVIQSASYGLPGDAARTRDVRAKVQALADRGELEFLVAKMADGDDPAFGTVKTLRVEYTTDGIARTFSGQDHDTVLLGGDGKISAPAATVNFTSDGKLELIAREAGKYEIKTASGKTLTKKIPARPDMMQVAGPWQLNFPPKRGAPVSATLTNLVSWTDVPDDGVKHFSGTATYQTTFEISKSQLKQKNSRYFLELGEVCAMARVKVNGHDCGIAWRPPFRVEITDAVRAGKTELEIQVANLWPNRMIGDAALAETNRFTWSSWTPFKAGTPLLKSGLLGPVKMIQNTGQIFN
jgi:alpha-L-rhamnosidase